MATRRKTGEPQKTRQPFYVDRLPPAVRESIEMLKNQFGKTYEQIESLSAEKYEAKFVPLGCFVDWDNLDPEVAKLFPNRKIPASNLQRWCDVRLTQVHADVMHRAQNARVLAKAFVGAKIKGDDDAILYAARDTFMGLMAEDSSTAGRENAAKNLLRLAEVTIKARTNKIRERKVAVDEQTLQVKLDEMKRKAGELLKDVEGGAPGQPVHLTREELLEKVKGIYGTV